MASTISRLSPVEVLVEHMADARRLLYELELEPLYQARGSHDELVLEFEVELLG